MDSQNHVPDHVNFSSSWAFNDLVRSLSIRRLHRVRSVSRAWVYRICSICWMWNIPNVCCDENSLSTQSLLITSLSTCANSTTSCRELLRMIQSVLRTMSSRWWCSTLVPSLPSNRSRSTLHSKDQVRVWCCFVCLLCQLFAHSEVLARKLSCKENDEGRKLYASITVSFLLPHFQGTDRYVQSGNLSCGSAFMQSAKEQLCARVIQYLTFPAWSNVFALVEIRLEFSLLDGVYCFWTWDERRGRVQAHSVLANATSTGNRCCDEQVASDWIT